MRRRDRQSEIVVALVIAVAMAFVLAISMLLAIGGDESLPSSPPLDQTAEPSETASAESTVISQAVSPTPTDTTAPTAVPNTSTATPTASPSDTRTPHRTDTPSPSATDTAPTAVPNTSTATPTASPSDTHTPHRTDTPSPSATDTVPPTATSSDTPTLTLTYTPFGRPRTAAPSRTPIPSPSATNTPRPTQTHSPSPSPSITPTVCAPRADWEPYTVQRGENFFRIALRYNLSMQALAQANCIQNTAVIFAGQQLVVPPGGPTSPTQTERAEGCDTPYALITAPRAGAILSGMVTLEGVAYGPDFRRYILDWRPDDPRVDYRSFEEIFTAFDTEATLGTFNTDAFSPGAYWFRLRVLETNDFIIGECSIRVQFDDVHQP